MKKLTVSLTLTLTLSFVAPGMSMANRASVKQACMGKCVSMLAGMNARCSQGKTHELARCNSNFAKGKTAIKNNTLSAFCGNLRKSAKAFCSARTNDWKGKCNSHAVDCIARKRTSCGKVHPVGAKRNACVDHTTGSCNKEKNKCRADGSSHASLCNTSANKQHTRCLALFLKKSTSMKFLNETARTCKARANDSAKKCRAIHAGWKVNCAKRCSLK